ncbi:MAG: hypothetical protein ABI832_06525 [bacterium]
MRHIIPLLAASLGLSACVLQSTEAQFGDADASLLFGNKPVTLALSGPDQSGLNLPATITATPENYHYRLTPGGARSYFVPLGQDHYVVQLVQPGITSYAVATGSASGLTLGRLDCARIKTDLRTNLLVEFKNNSCSLRATDQPKADFVTLLSTAADLSPPLRLSPSP